MQCLDTEPRFQVCFKDCLYRTIEVDDPVLRAAFARLGGLYPARAIDHADASLAAAALQPGREKTGDGGPAEAAAASLARARDYCAMQALLETPDWGGSAR